MVEQVQKNSNVQIEETVDILEQGENDDVNERTQKRTITINNSTTQSEV